MDVSVITPAYNEERAVEASVNNILSALKGVDFELIVVNDGSKDRTLEILKRLVKDEPRLKVISYPNNRGRGYAMRMGFSQASGSIIVTTESDLSWGKDIVQRLVKALKDNPHADMVIASPHAKGGGYKNVPFKRKMLSTIGNKVLSRAVGHGITMSSGMTRAYQSYMIKDLPLEEDRKEIHLEILSKVLDLGYKVIEIPAVLSWKKERSKRGKSSFNAKKLIMTHLLFTFNESPILLIGNLSLLSLLAGSVIGVMLLYQFFMDTLNPTRPLVTIMVILLITGLQMLIFSFLAYQNRLLRKEVFRGRMQKQENKNVTVYRCQKNM